MKRKPAAAVFKPYVVGQVRLLPPSYDELIEAGHLVRVVNDAIDQLDLSPLLAQYKGGGTSSYHPLMMLKILVYASTPRRSIPRVRLPKLCGRTFILCG